MDTTPISIRLDNSLLEDIDFMAKEEGVDRATWIKNSLRHLRDGFFEEMKKDLAKDFIQLIIDEKEFENIAKKKVPEDLKKARQEYLKNISQREEE